MAGSSITRREFIKSLPGLSIVRVAALAALSVMAIWLAVELWPMRGIVFAVIAVITFIIAKHALMYVLASPEKRAQIERGLALDRRYWSYGARDYIWLGFVMGADAEIRWLRVGDVAVESLVVGVVALVVGVVAHAVWRRTRNTVCLTNCGN